MVQKVEEGVENFQPLQKVGGIFNFETLDDRYDFVAFYALNNKHQTYWILDTISFSFKLFWE
jgi:hypothetical protein